MLSTISIEIGKYFPNKNGVRIMLKITIHNAIGFLCSFWMLFIDKSNYGTGSKKRKKMKMFEKTPIPMNYIKCVL